MTLFDKAWNARREQIFENQKELGELRIFERAYGANDVYRVVAAPRGTTA